MLEFLKCISRGIYILFELILVNFNLPWFLLIFTLLFKDELMKLLKRVSKISYGESSIEFLIQDSQRELFLADKRLEQKHENLYGYPRKVERGAGGMPYFESVPEKYNLSFILNDGEIETYYNENSSVETMKKMYQLYVNQYAYEFNLESGNYKAIIQDMEKNSPEEISILKTLNRFYTITVENSKTSDMWRLSDILKFKRMIVTALNLRDYRRNG